MARIKETVSRDGKSGTRRVSTRGQSAARKMTSDEVKHKNQKTKVMVFGGLAGGDTKRVYSSNTGRKTYFTGGGF